MAQPSNRHERPQGEAQLPASPSLPAAPTPPKTGEVPTPPGYQALQAPWRLAYLEGLDASEKTKGPPKAGSGSFLYDAWLAPELDLQNLIIVRSSMGMVLLNKYPYANGHLLVALGEPRPTLLDYDPEQRAAFWGLVELATELMQRTLEPQGVNFGINQGRAAGAGVPQHLHAHLVPRWSGDVNFMQVVGAVKVIPASLEAMLARYTRTFAQMRSAQA
jgi:ATP adenylyltransferase